MAKEYKFMFDRRFDDDETKDVSFSVEDFPSEEQSAEGVPSISQLLDSLNEQIGALSDHGKKAPLFMNVPEENEPAASRDALPVETETPADSSTRTGQAFPASAVPEQTEPDEKRPVFTITPEEIEQEKIKAREQGRLSGLEEGRLSGMEEGRQSAWQEAMESIQKQNSDLLLSIDTSLKELSASVEQYAQSSFSTAVEFALAVCKKALPALSETNAVEEIKSLLEKNLHFLKDEQKISLRLNPAQAKQIKPVLTDLIKKESYHGKVSIVRDDSLPAGDCRIEWKNGGLEKKLQDVLNHTEELVNLYTHTAPAVEPSAEHIGETHHG